MKKMVPFLLMIVLLVLSYRFVFHKTISFEYVMTIKTNHEFRSANGLPIDDQGLVWYSISKDPYTEYDLSEIEQALSDSGTTLDMAKYSYLVVKGYSLEKMYVNYLNSEKLNEKTRRWTGYVVLGKKCAPDEINVYRFKKMLIVPPKHSKLDHPFVVILQ